MKKKKYYVNSKKKTQIFNFPMQKSKNKTILTMIRKILKIQLRRYNKIKKINNNRINKRINRNWIMFLSFHNQTMSLILFIKKLKTWFNISNKNIRKQICKKLYNKKFNNN